MASIRVKIPEQLLDALRYVAWQGHNVKLRGNQSLVTESGEVLLQHIAVGTGNKMAQDIWPKVSEQQHAFLLDEFERLVRDGAARPHAPSEAK